jgi:hypothetical protein
MLFESFPAISRNNVTSASWRNESRTTAIQSRAKENKMTTEKEGDRLQDLICEAVHSGVIRLALTYSAAMTLPVHRALSISHFVPITCILMVLHQIDLLVGDKASSITLNLFR